jgi:hypothetical protein
MKKTDKVCRIMVAAALGDVKLSKEQLTAKVKKVTGFGTSLANLYIKSLKERASKEAAALRREARKAAKVAMVETVPAVEDAVQAGIEEMVA